MEIFAEFSATHRIERALLIAIPLILVTFMVLAGIVKPLQTIMMHTRLRRTAYPTAPYWPRWFVLPQWLALFLMGVFVAAPVGVLAMGSGGAQMLAMVTQEARAEIGFSLVTALAAAALSLPLSVVAANSLDQRSRNRWVLWFLLLVPLAIPASLIGAGIISLSLVTPSGGSLLKPYLPVSASLTRFVPLAVLLVLAQRQRRDPGPLEASLVFQPSWWRRAIQVSLPLAAPGLIAAAGLVFALTLGELGATLMVIPPGKATLTMRIYSYLHYGASSTVAGLALVIVAAVLTVSLLVSLVVRLWARYGLGGAR
jgi:iron(III) transport system permease protein